MPFYILGDVFVLLDFHSKGKIPNSLYKLQLRLLSLVYVMYYFFGQLNASYSFSPYILSLSVHGIFHLKSNKAVDQYLSME